jgi:DNA-directed RNA polymerase specialized sigma subunit
VSDSIFKQVERKKKDRESYVPYYRTAARPAYLPETGFGEYGKEKRNTEDIYKSWQETQSPEDLKELFHKLNPIINSALTSFAGGDKSLKTRAYILTREALNDYKPEKGAALKTHVFHRLKRLNRVSAERKSVVHVPENVRTDAGAIWGFRKEFLDKHGRDPNLDEVADGTGMSIRRAQKAMHGGEVPEGMTMSDKGHHTVDAHDRSREDIWQDYVYHDLDPISKKVFEWTTGYGGSEVLPKKEIAVKLKISAPAVSGRVSTIVKRLEELDR